MRRMAKWSLLLVYSGFVALGLYEVTAKSPSLLGSPLPGWGATLQAEFSTPWQPRTGVLPVDKLLHESQEACRFYVILGDF